MNRRVPIALPAGLAVALVLFGLMTLLVVEYRIDLELRPATSLRLDTARVLPDPVIEPPPLRPDTPPPPPPDQPAAPPEALSVPAPPLPSAALSLPDLGLEPRLTGLPQTGSALSGVVTGTGFGADESDDGQAGEGFSGRDLVPISSARPKYPRSAAERGIEGWVEVIFRIRPDGSVSDVRILDADPRGVFEDAAAAAVGKWIYAPYRRDGVPVEREAIQRLDFRTADIQPLYIWDD